MTTRIRRKKPPTPRFPALGKPTALVVDDHPRTRRATVEMLTEFGFTVLAASTATEAVVRARELGGPLDLLVTEATLADGRGDRLVGSMRREGVRPAVLFTSCLPRTDLRILGFTTRRDSILVRPFDDTALARRVRTLLGL